MRPYVCGKCGAQFRSSQSLNAHARKHSGYAFEGLKEAIYCCSVLTHKVIEIRSLDRHDAAWLKNNKICPHCGGRFVSCQKEYCSSRCAAIVNNAKFPRRRGPLPSGRKRHHISWRDFIVGPFTPVYWNVCAKTGRQFWYRARRKYHFDLYPERQEYARSCRFKFPVSDYPDLLDLSLLRDAGWYSTPGSRRGVRNVDGVSRDHLLSVDDGWRLGIAPVIMRHPANCRLLLHRENQKKNRRSAITATELFARIAAFDTAARVSI